MNTFSCSVKGKNYADCIVVLSSDQGNTVERIFETMSAEMKQGFRVIEPGDCQISISVGDKKRWFPIAQDRSDAVRAMFDRGYVSIELANSADGAELHIFPTP